jgi:hypothetical protein
MEGDHRQGIETRGAGLRSAVGDGGTSLCCTPTASGDGKPALRGVHRSSARGRRPGAAGEAREKHGEAQERRGGAQERHGRGAGGARERIWEPSSPNRI